MAIKPNLNLLALAALFSIVASAPVQAQAVYKCESSRGRVTYTEMPCSKRIVNTKDAPVPAKLGREEVDLRRIEQNRVVASAMRPRKGESADEFETRRRRARLLAHNRDECARIDTRMPVEQASLTNPDPQEVSKAETALAQSRKRIRELRC